jgi:pimeloyl-ACP methyl ester carboxylesterase
VKLPVKVTSALFACGVLLASLTAAMPAEAAAISCTDADLPVSGPGLPPLVPGAPATMRGRLCLPAGAGPNTDVPDTAQLLVHGGTYNSAYWDLPYQPGRYSYQRDMAAHGYATFAADEATKDQVSVPGMGTVALFGIVLPATKGITVPVFQVVGEKDVLFCGLLALRDCSSARALRAQEAPYYADPSKLSMYVLPGAGHSVALHENAADYRDATRSWLRDRLAIAPQGYHSIG